VSTLPESFVLAVDLAMAKGFRSIKDVPGCVEIEVDEHWRVSFNGHRQTAHTSTGLDVPPVTMAVEFNGWPAGLVNAGGGTIAAGALANEATLCEALRAALLRAGGYPNAR
jgi:hypothetical protein